MSEFEIFVSKEDFKFNCAHFICYPGFRERLHGHNYTLSVRLLGHGGLGSDGYLLDFGEIKRVARSLCKEMNEYFICPMKSDCIDIQLDKERVTLNCFDGSQFCFPAQDCVFLPLVHSSAEELAYYFWCQIIKRIGLDILKIRSINTIEISIAEAPNQMATFKGKVPLKLEDILDSPSFAHPSACCA